jgi:hypothetical protein
MFSIYHGSKNIFINWNIFVVRLHALYVAVINSGIFLHLNLIDVVAVVWITPLCRYRRRTSCEKIAITVRRNQDTGNESAPRRKE